MQNFHNAAYREEEREMFPTLKVSARLPLPPSIPLGRQLVHIDPTRPTRRPSVCPARRLRQLFGAGAIPWSPLCRGFLARPWKAEETLRVKTDANYKARGIHLPDKSRQTINERVEEIANKRGLTMAQVALAWSLGNEDITAPIVGTTKLDNLKELIGALTDGGQTSLMTAALDVELTREERKYIEEAYEPRSIVSPLNDVLGIEAHASLVIFETALHAAILVLSPVRNALQLHVVHRGLPMIAQNRHVSCLVCPLHHGPLERYTGPRSVTLLGHLHTGPQVTRITCADSSVGSLVLDTRLGSIVASMRFPRGRSNIDGDTVMVCLVSTSRDPSRGSRVEIFARRGDAEVST